MKAFLMSVLVLASVSASVTALAEDSILKGCHSGDERVEILIEQTGADISMKVQDVARKYSPQGGTSGYNILAQEGVSYVVKDKRLADFANDKAILQKMITSGLFQLRQFDGEYDMIYYYVGKYMSGLKCN